MCLPSPQVNTSMRRLRSSRCSLWPASRRGHALPVFIYWLLLVLLLSFVIVCTAYDLAHVEHHPHACGQCSRSYSVLGALRRHYRRDHPGVAFSQQQERSPSPPPNDAAPVADAAPLGAQPSSAASPPENRAAPPTAFSSSCPDAGPTGIQASVPTAVAGSILAYYRKWGDRITARPIVEHVEGGRPDVFNTPSLKKVPSFSLSVGGGGLSGPDRELFWDNLATAKRQSMASASATAGKGPPETAF